MNLVAILAVGLGAVLGAWARWGLATWLHPGSPGLPLGTLVANLGGGYAIGPALHSAAHLFGSIVATLLGFATYRTLA